MVLTILATYKRLRYGVDFTDEAFYLAIPHYFLLGGKPFVDQVGIVQLQSLLLLPLVKSYYQFVGSMDGILLFARHAYLLFNIFVAVITFLCIRSVVPGFVAALISLSCVAFIPLNIPALSYNTMGSGFFTIGSFLGAWTVINQKRPGTAALSGMAHGFAVIAYPTLSLASVVFIGILSALQPTARLRTFLAYVAGAALPIIVLAAPAMIQAGLDNLMISISYAGAFGLRDTRNVALVFLQISDNKLTIILLILIFAAAYMKRPALAAPIIFFLPLVVFLMLEANRTYISVNWYIITYALMAPLFLIFIGHQKKARQVFFVVWVPSFIAGLIVAWSSGNGAITAAVGLFPASLVTTIFMVMTFMELSSRFSTTAGESINPLWLTIPPVLVTLFLVIYQFGMLYRDDGIFELDTQVKTGPYAGLWTTHEKNEFLTGLANDISALSKSEDTVLFYDRFPAGYLLTSMRPATNTVWLFQVADYQPNLDRSGLIHYYHSRGKFPDLAIRMKHIPYTRTETNNLVYPAGDLLNNMIDGPQYRMVLSRENYTIFRKVKVKEAQNNPL